MKTDLPPPNQPLQNPRHERFAGLVADGHPQSAAYRKVYPTAGLTASRTTASQLANLPHVKARIQWLKTSRKDQSAPPHAQKAPIARDARRDTVPTNATNNTPISRDEVIQQLSVAIRNGTTSDITQATQALIKIMPELGAKTDDDKPDPLAVANYLAAWAGYPGHDLAKELGGLELLTRKWIHVLQVDIRELQAVINKIARSGNEPEADPQTA